MSEHRSFPKPAPRLLDRTAQRRADEAALRACYRAVDLRDAFKCRCCGVRTTRTLALTPTRAEHHHLVGRWIAPMLRANRKNICHVCAGCHFKLTRHDLLVKAATFYVIEGRSYPDADGPLAFI